LKLGTKLTIYLSLIIILFLTGYGYFHILSRRDMLIRKMKTEVHSTGRTLKVALEKISIPREMEHVQELIDAVQEYEKTLGVIVYHKGRDLVFRSRSIEGEIGPYLALIKRSIETDLPSEGFKTYEKISVFSFTFPLKDHRGKNIGGVSLLQHISFMEEEIESAQWNIVSIILVLVGGTVVLFLFATKRWITRPISQLMEGIKRMARGQLNPQINLTGEDELSELGQAFNQMAMDLKRAREQLIREGEIKLELERSLRQSEKLATIGQLASGLAHEIGTPLNIISGRAELMTRRLEDKEGLEKNLNVILNQTERITKIIQQLLGFVRKKKPEQRPLNLGPILESTLDFLGQQIQKQKIKVVKDLGDHLPAVTGDPDQLQQVLLNLMVNAIQSMPEGGELRLIATPQWVSKEGLEEGQRQYVEIRVEDTGVGMEREVIKNIFNPFFTTKEKERGTGLGLTVSQGIVQDHEGWIDVESEAGKGSVFKVFLPAAKE
jgi:two-component system, NtrC family, sensor kinase